MRIFKAALLACTILTCIRIAPASTISIYDVSIKTESLVGHPAGPFSVLVVLTDGSGLGDGNATVTLTRTNFGGGGGLGNPLLLGGASGDLEAGVTISDNSFLNLFSEPFSAGSTLQFRLSLTASAEGSETPDRITISILDRSGTALATLAPAGNFLISVDLTPSLDSVEIFGNDPSRPPSVGIPISIDAPAVPFASRAVKAAARTALFAILPTGHPETDEELLEAVHEVDESLAADLWVDDFHLTARGTRVFKKERDAVHEFTEHGHVSQGLIGQLDDVANTLARADHGLAQTALDEAQLASADNDDLTHAQKNFARGDKLVVRGRFEQAIEHYEEAWRAAQQAIHGGNIQNDKGEHE